MEPVGLLWHALARPSYFTVCMPFRTGLLGERRASMLVLATILESAAATARGGGGQPQASVLMMTPELADLRWESIADGEIIPTPASPPPPSPSSSEPLLTQSIAVH